MAPRVAFITHYADLLGANRSMMDLVLELRARDAADPVAILPREGPLSERLAKENVPFQVFPFQPWMSERHYSGRLHHRFGQWRRYERAARERASSNARLLPAIAAWLRGRHVDLIHANSAAVAIAPGLKAATGLPLAWHIRELPERQYLLHLDMGRRAYRRALMSADALIAISRAVHDDLLRYAPKARPVLIYNGVLSSAAYAGLRVRSEERWAATDPFVFALVGLIHPSKGQEEAIEAVDLLRKTRPGVKLVIAGHGKDDHLRALIQRLDLQAHVEMRGYVPDPFAVFHRAHACLMCSRNEAMGRVTVEAMAAGLPVIGHASGGTLELVQDEVSGLIYPGGIDALAARMRRLVDDAGLARSLGERAMADAATRFSIERMGEAVLRVHAEVLGRG